MPIFNFKKFNESVSEPVVLTEEHRVILEDIIEDVWTMEIESMDSLRRPSIPDITRSNICLRSSVKYEPGEIAALVDYRLSPDTMVNKSNIYGFSIRTWEKHKHLLKRCLDLFKRQTGIELSTYTNGERQTIIADPKVIKFIENILQFEYSWEELEYILPQKYNEDVEIQADSCDLEIQLHFPAKNRQSTIVGCYLDMKLSRGLVIGGDLPLDDNVKYELKIGTVWNFEEKRDSQDIWRFGKIHKGEEYEFEFDVSDPDSANEELIKFIQENILSKIELSGVRLKSKLESQLNKLRQWSIKPSFEYLKNDLLEIELVWKGDQYQFHLHLNKLGNQSLEGLISIKQGDNWIDKSSIEELAETIYLNLVDGKLKITQ